MPVFPQSKMEKVDFNKVAITELLSNKSVQQLLDIVDLHPEWSIEEFAHYAESIQLVLDYQEIRAILGRLHLSTALQRKIRQAKTQEWEQSGKEYTKQLISQTIPDFFSYIAHRKEYQKYQWQNQAKTTPKLQTIPPKLYERYKTYEKFLYLSRLFGLAFIASFVFLVSGSVVFDTLFHAVGILGKIGMFFAFSALFFGIFFFLYSLKYYITVALVLSYSRETKDFHSVHPWASFFRKIFGMSVEVTADVTPEYKPSLSYDLESIRLEREPFVSIHVGTFNEKRVIDRFLLAATSIDYTNYEIIVADDSNDETVQLLEKWASHPKVKISHRNVRTGYKGAALKEALKKINPRTEYVLIFDADFIPYPDSIVQFLKYFQSMLGSLDPSVVKESPIAAVQGYQWHILNKSENWITRGVRAEYSGSYIIERSGEELYQGMKQISGSVYMIRTDVLKLVDWGTSITEDFELTLKLYQRGYKVIYTPYLQTPAEAVSTIKRLIRQRMRWAEGHSFNVKKMFKTLLKSEYLSAAEKFEFIYFAPYYLQAFFFLIGTFCWFIAEIIFQTKLPFWTEVWGWSLVFTNLLSIPLMNMVGLFMEESDEKDYLGLLSFILLSYIVAPFQAFAAVKGFLEKEEGPWFRTPKTGRITDNFVPGRFYRFVRGILGQASITTSLSLQKSSTKVFSFANQSASLPIPFQYATAKAIPSFRNRYKWTGKAVIALCLIVVTFLNYLTFFAPKAEAAWFNSGYLRKKAITIDHTKVGRPAFDAQSFSNNTTSVSSVSFSHTVGNYSNRLLIVSVNSNASLNNVSSVTYNGSSLNRITSVTNSTVGDAELWYMVAPSTGAHNVVVNYSSAAATDIGVASFYDVNQTNPLGNSNTAIGSVAGTSASVSIGTTPNQLLLDGLWLNNSGDTLTAGSSQTKIWSSITFGTGSYRAASGTSSSTTLSWTITSDLWEELVVAINPADLSNFPVLISRTDTDIKSAVNSGLVQNTSTSGGTTIPDDLVFVSSDETTKLDHEIEKYVANTGEIEAWVRIPTLSASSDTVIYMYFDNSSVSTSQENKTGVWDTNFKGVWHMKEDPSGTAPQIKDSTSDAFNGTSEGSMTSGESVAAQIGNGVSFNGSNQDINVAHNTALNLNSSFTISFWSQFTGTETGSFPSMIGKGASATANGWLFYENAANNQLAFKRNNLDFGVTSNNTIDSSTLRHYVVVYDSAAQTLTGYVNGSQDLQTTSISYPTDSGTDALLMANTDGFANIILDEVHISNTNRSIGWIDTEYNNQSSPSTFYNFSAISTNTTNPTVEQQINIIDQTYTTLGTTDSPTDNSLGLVNWDGTKYTGDTVYFEAVMKNDGTHTSTATLYTSGGSTVSGSAITTTSSSYTRVRSSSVTLSDGTDYTIRLKTSSGGTASIIAARLIVVQTSATLITDTLGQVEVGSNDNMFGTRVQRGSVTMTTTSTTVTVTPVNVNRSFLVCSPGTSTSAAPSLLTYTCDLTNSTTITFTRSGTATMTLQWQLIEYDNIRVQSGTLALATGTASTSYTIPTPINQSKTFLVETVRSDDTSGTNHASAEVSANITSSTNVTFTRANTTGNLNISFFIVSFADDTYVEQWTTTMTAASSATATINGPNGLGVDPTRSFAIGYSQAASGQTGMAYTLVATALTNGTTVTTTRGGASGNNTTYGWVVQLPQAGAGTSSAYAQTISNSSISTSPTNDTLSTSIDTNRSFVWGSFTNSGTGTAYNNSLKNYSLSNSNTYQITYLSNGNTATAQGFAVQLPDWRTEMNPKVYYFDSNKFSSTLTAYFEATLSSDQATASAQARLFNVTDNEAVTNASVSVSGTTWARSRSSALTIGSSTGNLKSGKEYVVQLNYTSGVNARLANAHIILSQTNSGGITDTEIIHNYVNQAEGGGGSTYASQNFLNQFNPSDWAGGTFTYYYEADHGTNSGTSYSQLYNNTDSSAVTSSELTTTNSYVNRLRSASLGMPTSAKDLDTQTKGTFLTLTQDATGSNTSGGNVSSLSWTHVTASTGNSLLLVGVVTDVTHSFSTVTYNGTNLTKFATKPCPTSVFSNGCDLELWYLLSPDPGSHNVVATLTTGTADIDGGSVSYYNADQFTPIATFNTNSGSTASNQATTVSVNTSNSSQVVLGLLGSDNTTTNGAGQTQLWLKSFVEFSGGASKAGTGSSVTMTWNVNSGDWAQIAAPINAASVATDTSSSLIIDVHSLSTPEHIWFFFPLIFFLPKFIEYLSRKRRRKPALAMVYNRFVQH